MLKCMGAVALIAGAYGLGKAKGSRLRRMAENTIALAGDIENIAELVEARSLSVVDAVKESAATSSSAFLVIAAEKISEGEPPPHSLAAAIRGRSSDYEPAAVNAALRVFYGIGRQGLSEEIQLLKRAAETVRAIGDKSLCEQQKLSNLFKTVYTLAGAAIAVLLM